MNSNTAGPCRIEGCPGHYEPGRVERVMQHEGQTVLFENVPAEVCTVCGDYVMRLSAGEEMERLVNERQARGVRPVPVYEYEEQPAREAA